MRIVFMGTPDFAEASLRALYDAGHEIAGVFTQPDRPRSRGLRPAQSPVKKLALEMGSAVFQPETLRGGEAVEQMRELAPELIAVVAYGKILPPEMLAIPPLGCVNIHGSLLPAYRGSAPIQWAVLNGETHTGVTAMYMSEEMDAGDIIDTAETDIGEYETSGELFDRLMVMGAQLLVKTLGSIERGEAKRTPQDGARATFAPMIKKDMCPIDWNSAPGAVLCKIRGLDPWPVATAELFGTVFRIYGAFPSVADTGKAPGTVLSADKEGIRVACAGGSVLITELQAAGGKRMPAGDYLRGHPVRL